MKIHDDGTAGGGVPVSLTTPEGISDGIWDQLAERVDGVFEINERDADGVVIGTAIREANGNKRFVSGGQRGLIYLHPLDRYEGTSADSPIFVCEGASDTAALLSVGLSAVGIPMAGTGAEMLAALLADRHAVLVADRDDAGRSGMEMISGVLVHACSSVRTILPPGEAKDARASVIAGATQACFLETALAVEPARPGTTVLSSGLVMSPLSAHEIRPVQWVWPNRVASGKLTLLSGDPGLGKSFVTLDIAARVTSGVLWPDGSTSDVSPGSVIVLNAEDDPGDTVRPRLEALGADIDRIAWIEGVATKDPKKNGNRSLDLAEDVAKLEQAVEHIDDCRLIVVDPVSAYMGNTDSHKNSDVRSVLEPLSHLASRHEVAILMVSHLNKNSGGKAIYRTSGSLAYAAAARSGWLIVKDPEDPDRRIMVSQKNNLVAESPGLAYRIESIDLDGTVKVCWDPEPVRMQADDLINAQAGGSRSELDLACEWLEGLLINGRRVRANDLRELAEDAGHSWRTVGRAKTQLGIKSEREGFGPNGHFWWVLP